MGAKNDGGGLDVSMSFFIAIITFAFLLARYTNSDFLFGKQAFVTREISEDFDLDLYNEFLTKVLHSNTGRFQGYFVAK